MPRVLQHLALAAVATMSLSLGGCAAPHGAPSGAHSSHANPQRAAKWSAEIRAEAQKARSDVTRRALSDGKITDSEYAFFRANIIRCLAQIGVTAKWDDARSLSYTLPPGVKKNQVDACDQKAGMIVIVLYDAIARNPEHEDESQLMVDCLRRAKVVPSTYSREMYDSGTDMDRILSTDGFEACNTDPVHSAR